jgi:hypothetical protein
VDNGNERTNGTRARGRAAVETDVDLFNHIEATLYTAVIADALDELGHHDCAMREYLRPLDPHAKFTGWARTIQCQDVFYEPADPYGLEIEISGHLPTRFLCANCICSPIRRTFHKTIRQMQTLLKFPELAQSARAPASDRCAGSIAPINSATGTRRTTRTISTTKQKLRIGGAMFGRSS